MNTKEKKEFLLIIERCPLEGVLKTENHPFVAKVKTGVGKSRQSVLNLATTGWG